MPGAQPYVPTKIQWLCLDLNAESADELTDESKYSKHFTYSAADPNTVIVFVRYLPDMDRELLNTVVNNAKEIVRLKSRSYGWEDWVKVSEDVKMSRSNK